MRELRVHCVCRVNNSPKPLFEFARNLRAFQECSYEGLEYCTGMRQGRFGLWLRNFPH
jgi:hypothetical protein